MKKIGIYIYLYLQVCMHDAAIKIVVDKGN